METVIALQIVTIVTSFLSPIIIGCAYVLTHLKNSKCCCGEVNIEHDQKKNQYDEMTE